MGGICTIILVLFVGTFTLGLFAQWARSEYSESLFMENTNNASQDYLYGCSETVNNCMTMANTEWVPFVSIVNKNQTVGENLTAYVVPQFYTYQKDFLGKTS